MHLVTTLSKERQTELKTLFDSVVSALTHNEASSRSAAVITVWSHHGCELLEPYRSGHADKREFEVLEEVASCSCESLFDTPDQLLCSTDPHTEIPLCAIRTETGTILGISGFAREENEAIAFWISCMMNWNVRETLVRLHQLSDNSRIHDLVATFDATWGLRTAA